MKNFRFLLPSILTAGIFMYSCGNADRGSNNSTRKEAPPHSMADSISANGGFANTPPYEEQETGPGLVNVQSESGKQNRYTMGNSKDVSVSAMYLDQTEISNNEYKNFVEYSRLMYMMSSTAAKPTHLDSTHRFIRTADIRFRVKDVAIVSYRIEDIARKFDGYVADTKLNSQLTYNYEKPVSADSSLQTMKYLVTNSIVLRIPVANLDTTLKSLVKFIDYLDYRNINTNDITLDMLANQLAQKRIAKFNQRLAFDIDNKGKKLDDVQSAETSLLQQQENSDNAFIENLRKDDQVKYSTVTINIYQKETIRQELIAREKDIDEYEPGLGSKLGESFQSGWHGLQAIIIGIVILWPLWLIGAGTWMLIRYLLRRNKKLKG